MGFDDQYLHPLWKKKRLEVLVLYGYRCQHCHSEEETLHVHHKRYFRGRNIWEYDNADLTVLCADCHKAEHYLKDILMEVFASISQEARFDAICLLVGYFSSVAGPRNVQFVNQDLIASMSQLAFRLGEMAAEAEIVVRDSGYSMYEVLNSLIEEIKDWNVRHDPS